MNSNIASGTVASGHKSVTWMKQMEYKRDQCAKSKGTVILDVCIRLRHK